MYDYFVLPGRREDMVYLEPDMIGHKKATPSNTRGLLALGTI